MDDEAADVGSVRVARFCGGIAGGKELVQGLKLVVKTVVTLFGYHIEVEDPVYS